MDYLNEQRQILLQEKLKEAKSESERLQLARQLFMLIQANGESIVNSLENGIEVTNLDEIKASLHNELGKGVKKLESALKGLKVSTEETGRIISAIQSDHVKNVEDNFQTITIKRPRDKVEVLNLSDIFIPDQVKITNLSDIQDYFEKLGGVIKDTFNVEIKPPVVNVEAPRIDVPAPIINTTVDMGELKDQLHKLNQSLIKIKNNRDTNPLAVRLSDGQEFIDQLEKVVETQRQQIAAFPGKIRLDKKSEVSIKPYGTPVGGRKSVTAAGTAERIVASSTPCSQVTLNADLGNTNPIVVGGSDVDATADSQNGIILIPGNNPVTISVSDLYDIYVDAQTNGDSVCFMYVS